MNTFRLLKKLLLIAAAVSIAALFFTKKEAIQYICFAIFMLLFAISATEDYKKEKKRFSLILAILCYAICLLQMVLFTGTILQLS